MEIYAEGLTRAAFLDARFPHSFRQGQTEGCEFQKSPPTPLTRFIHSKHEQHSQNLIVKLKARPGSWIHRVSLSQVDFEDEAPAASLPWWWGLSPWNG